jgi:predicted nucleic acid-binding Zn ribbon protein
MKHLDDHRRCPRCGEDINQRGYTMSRNSDENVFSTRQVAWLLVFVLALLIIIH